MASQIQDDARRTNIIFPELASGYLQYFYSLDYAVAGQCKTDDIFDR